MAAIVTTAGWAADHHPGTTAGDTEAVVCGAVMSMLTPTTPASARLPARSNTDPLADFAAPSVASVTGSGQWTTPLRSSAQANVTLTSPLFQPAALAGVRSTEMVGSVLSSLTVAESVPRLPAPSRALPSTCVPDVSVDTTWSGVIELATTPLPPVSSVAVKCTVTSLRFQSSALAVGVRMCDTIGARLS